MSVKFDVFGVTRHKCLVNYIIEYINICIIIECINSTCCCCIFCTVLKCISLSRSMKFNGETFCIDSIKFSVNCGCSLENLVFYDCSAVCVVFRNSKSADAEYRNDHHHYKQECGNLFHKFSP